MIKIALTRLQFSAASVLIGTAVERQCVPSGSFTVVHLEDQNWGWIAALGISLRSSAGTRAHLSTMLSRENTVASRESFLLREGLLPALPVLADRGIDVCGIRVADNANLEKYAKTEALLLRRLVESGIEFSLAGAAAAAWSAYPSPMYRERSELLCLMSMAGCQLARPVLLDLNFKPVRSQSRVMREEVWRQPAGEGDFRVVLRWGVCDHPLLARRFSISGALARSRSLGEALYDVRVLDRVFSVLFQATQFFDRWHARPRMIDLLDQDLAWRALTNQDQQDLLQLARQRAVAGLVEAHLRLVSDIFGTPVPDEMLNSLDQSSSQERSAALVRGSRSTARYHWLAARNAQGLRARWQHLRAAFRG